MDEGIKLGLLAAFFGAAAVAVDAVPPAPVNPKMGKHKGKFKSGGCTPCQGQADARQTLRDAAKVVGMPARSAVPR